MKVIEETAEDEKSKIIYYMMKDLPDWWMDFVAFCKSRSLPMRTVILWLVSKFLSESEMQAEYAKWLMSEKKAVDNGQGKN